METIGQANSRIRSNALVQSHPEQGCAKLRLEC
jgi:hypothetical protein